MTQILAVIYQGEQNLMGPGNVGLELFAQLQKIQVKFEKNAQKKAKLGSNFFHTLTYVK